MVVYHFEHREKCFAFISTKKQQLSVKNTLPVFPQPGPLLYVVINTVALAMKATCI
jgi:hypothetical protein